MAARIDLYGLVRGPAWRLGAWLVCVVLLAAAPGCDRDGSGGGGGQAALAGTGWKLTSWSAAAPDPGSYTITAAFDGERISGISAVNSYGGPYSAGSDGRFSVGDLMSTLMAGTEEAMRAEQLFLERLRGARRYALDGQTLTLLDEAGNALLAFTRA